MKIVVSFLLMYVLLLTQNTFCQQAPVVVANLKVAGLANMKGLVDPHPLLSWQILSQKRGVVQNAFEILVASSSEKITANMGDVWSSQKINSNQSINVAYPISNLVGTKAYYWKVKIWTNKGQSAWSKPCKFIMGILDASTWKASWIGNETINKSDDPYSIFSRLSARYFRKEMSLKSVPVRATAFICGLGLYELNINGKKVGNAVLAPTVKEYDKEVPYNTLDVTSYFRQGANAIGVVLGNGRFFTPRYEKNNGSVDGISASTNYGFPKLLMQILVEYKDGHTELLKTDATWKTTSNGPIIANNEFDGEEYNATKELTGWSTAGYKDAAWRAAELVTPPDGKLVTQTNENIAIKELLKPVSLYKTKNGTYMLDMGQNMVGWLKIIVQGKKGDTISMRFAETLKTKDSLYLDNIRSAKVTDKYILKGTGKEEWEPRFTYHGFRFVEIKGLKYAPDKKDFIGKVVYDDIPTIGNFETSDKTINQVYKNAYWGIRGNYRGMPTDCPQRDERMGWLGDRSVSSYGESFIFDNARLYAKWMGDIQAAQKESGSIADVAPTYWKIYSDDVTWPISFLIIPEMLRKQFGDSVTFKKQYPYMKKWMMYMWDTYQKDNLVLKDTYGDWCLPPESLEIIFSLDSTRNTKGSLIGAAYYYYALSLMKNYASMLKLENDFKQFDAMAVKTKTAFNKMFYNADSGYYANNTVTSNLLPLTFGLVQENEKQKVFDHIVQRTLTLYDGHVSTGLIGGQWLMRCLSDNGRPDIAYKIATNTTYPSWGYMAAQGATTIWELWNGNTANPAMNSGNHVMLLGDLLVWDYEYLAGIKSDNSDIAFKKIIMDPYLAPGLTFVKASTQSPYGNISSYWRTGKDKFSWDVTIPANTKAVLAFPVTDIAKIKEGGINADKVEDIHFLEIKNNKVFIEIGSGAYSFSYNNN